MTTWGVIVVNEIVIERVAMETSDPNGIRTRVTCVKGGCPRPLDDGVNDAVFRG
jgi:hypothetical protein